MRPQRWLGLAILLALPGCQSSVTDSREASLGVDPASLAFSSEPGSHPPTQTLSITNPGGGTLSWTVSANQAWLSLSPTSGTNGGTVSVTVDAAGLAVGTHNATITVNANVAASPVSIPVTLAVPWLLTQVSTGVQHTCGRTSTGAAYCWGYNAFGELGDGTTTDRLVPTAVSGGLTFSQVSTGYSHTCALTPAGVAYCWGFDAYGQIGDGNATYRPVSVPTRVVG